MDLLDYLSSDLTAELQNDQTRLIAGEFRTDVNITEEHLRVAIGNIHNDFDVVGISERFDESLLLIKHLFKWKNIFYIPLNVTFKRPPVSSLPDDILAVIKEKNHFDIQLYQYANGLLDQSIADYGPSFSSDLRSFTGKNDIYRFFMNPLYRTLRAFRRNK